MYTTYYHAPLRGEFTLLAWHNERGKHGQYDRKPLQLIHASASQTMAILR